MNGQRDSNGFDSSGRVQPVNRPRAWSAQLLHRAMLPAGLVFAMLCVLEIVLRVFHVSSYLLPPPTVILGKLVSDWHNIGANLLVTATEALSGFALATIFAVALAVAFVYSERVERAILPLAIVVQTIPIIVIVPILAVALGNGLAPKITISALITFFPTLVNMTRGLKTVDNGLLELFDTLNASRLQTLIKLRFPSAVPYLFASLRIGAANCFIGAIVAEWVSADRGIGYLAQIYLYQIKVDLVYASVLASSIAAVLLSGFFGLLELILCPWRRAATTRDN